MNLARAVLAFLLVALFGAYSLLPYFVPIPAGEAGTLIIGVTKVIENAVFLVLGFYFGSTVGSADKTKILADLAAKPPPNAPPADEFTIPPPSA